MKQNFSFWTFYHNLLHGSQFSLCVPTQNKCVYMYQVSTGKIASKLPWGAQTSTRMRKRGRGWLDHLPPQLMKSNVIRTEAWILFFFFTWQQQLNEKLCGWEFPKGRMTGAREREVQKRKSFHPWGDVLWYTVAGLWERGSWEQQQKRLDKINR